MKTASRISYLLMSWAILSCSTSSTNNSGSGSNPASDSASFVSLSNNIIAERSPVDTTIGTFQVTDTSLTNVTYELVANSSGRFKLVGSELQVASSELLDYETSTLHTINLGVTVNGAFSNLTFTVYVTDIDEVMNNQDSGAGSLRQVIADASTDTTIYYDQNYSGDEIEVATEITIDKNITIMGASTYSMNVSGTSRLFNVASNGQLTLHRLILRNGDAGSSDSGGCIYNAGILNLFDVEFSGCQALSGGAVYSVGTTHIERSTFRQNSTTDGTGGAIMTVAPLTVVNSTFYQNSTSGSARSAGAIGCYENVMAFSSYMTAVRIISSTFFLNTATGDGGALHSDFCDLTLRMSLFAANTAGGTGDNITTGGTATLTAAAANFIDDGTGTTLVNGDGQDQIGTSAATLDPLLNTLADNGGYTQTLLPQAASPVLDAAAAAHCLDAQDAALATDQRSVARPQGSACDIGAVEVQ